VTLPGKIVKTVAHGSAVAVLFFGTLHADSVTNLTEEVITLRSEVERLHSELDDEKEALKSKIRSLALQKSELEANIRREETRIKQLQDGIAKQKELIARNSSGSLKLVPAVLAAAEALEDVVEQSLPFKKTERLNAIKEIATQLQSSLITPEKAANRLWAFCEDEIRMTKENGIFRQSVTLEGEERLVDVARIGMVAMYFKTGDDVMGYVQKSNNAWSYRLAESSAQKEQIATLFDAFKKQIRSGFFTIPNTLSETEAN
jgi:predicted RNase H-like nuclease (RuvC/YqgF family)